MPENGFVFPYGITLDEDGQVSAFPAFPRTTAFI